MAYTRKTKPKSETVTEEFVVDANAVNIIVDDSKTADEKSTTKKATQTKEKKTFASTDLIPCVSITAGELFYIGSKTDTLYTFADINDTQDIQFQDLDYAVRRKDVMMFKPRFIVQDEDFVKLHPELDAVYSSLHSVKDLKDILKMNVSQMKATIESLPVGAKESLKSIVATMVDNGTLDSVKKVKALDEILDTQMFMKLISE